MWHRKHFFPGKGIFWIFILIFMFGGFEKSGFPVFIVPFIMIWFFGSMLSGIIRIGSRSNRAERQVRWEPLSQPVVVHVGKKTAVPPAPRPAQEPAPNPSNLPSRCKACGGPVNETTVDRRGGKARCGYCGTGF